MTLARSEPRSTKDSRSKIPMLVVPTDWAAQFLIFKEQFIIALVAIFVKAFYS